MKIVELFESLQLNEAFTRGSNTVLSQPSLVSAIANQLRDDHTATMQQRQAFKKLDDRQMAEWFVGLLDNLERDGYGGHRFSRDGQFNFWAANNYAKGRDTLEDIVGTLPSALLDWTTLKNRNLLSQRHNDIQKFTGALALKRAMVTHYADKLEELVVDLKELALTKNKRSVKLVDNEDYKIYLLQNRGAAIAFGKGTTLCTSSTSGAFSQYWNRYATEGAVFGMVPADGKLVPAFKDYQPVLKPDGTPMMVKEKIQFDSPSNQFNDQNNRRINPENFKEKYPYFWTDLVEGLRANRAEIENNPEAEENPNVEYRTYNVDDIIDGLRQRFGAYLTNAVRPRGAATQDSDTRNSGA